SLASEGSRWHFRASSMSTKQLEGFSLLEMAHKMEAGAPKWWRLLGTLLNDKGMTDTSRKTIDDTPEVEGDVDDYWDEVDEIDLEGMTNGLTGEWDSCAVRKDRRAERRSAIKLMVRKKTMITGILMHGWNQKSNVLQSLLGLFLQSAHTPYKVIDTLARLRV
ncbi:hypothetical protein EDD15DRAFT_2142731, partial [Pisolithus albus]